MNINGRERTDGKKGTALVGTIVKLKVACLDNPIGTRGVCFELYKIGEGIGSSFIFGNGKYDGFSPLEQQLYLDAIGYSKEIENYKYSHVGELVLDFFSGTFTGSLNATKDES